MTPSIDALIEQLAAPQLGLVTRSQLRERGISGDVIDRRVRTTRLRRMQCSVTRAQARSGSGFQLPMQRNRSTSA